MHTPVFHVVIPARHGSTRFPGKPLADVGGRPMVVRVVEQALASGAATVAVASEDQRILNRVRAAGLERVRVLTTRADHPSGTDRVMEAAEQLQLHEQAIVINVQGDEPMIPPAAIRQVARMLHADPDVGAATLSEPITEPGRLFDPNVVKVVTAASGRALYFSRFPIPYQRGLFESWPQQAQNLSLGKPGMCWYRHIGIYGYRMLALRRFVNSPVADLERRESLEQLRLLDEGIALLVAPSEVPVPGGVDTPEDLLRLNEQLERTT